MKTASCLLLSLCLVAVACDDRAPFFIDTLILSDTVDPIGPYTVSTVVTDNRGVTEVELGYQIGLAAASIAVNCEQIETTENWNCLIPGPRRSTRIYYSLTARNSADKSARDPALAPDTYSFAVTLREPPPITVDAGATDRDIRDTRTTTDGTVGDLGAEDGGTEDASAEDTGVEDRSAADT